MTKATSYKPDIPEGIQIGDFIVGQYIKSELSRIFPWENLDHAALVTRVDPLTVIEASGIILQRQDQKSGKEEIREGVVEYEFFKPRTVVNVDGSENPEGNLWLYDDLKAMMWLQPKFPNPLREMAHWEISWKKRAVIPEAQARKRAVAFARSQVGEPFNIMASKFTTRQWYCSLLIFKSYSRTVTNMRLEAYGPAWYHVTPEDLARSKKSKTYYSWKRT